MKKRNFSVRDMCYCGIFAALMAVCAQIQIPAYVVSITLQTFAIFLALLTLGGFRGSICVGLYLLLGAVGLPVFSGFRGGIGAFYMESGGFLIGFMLTSLLYWAVTAEFKPEKWGKLLTLSAAMLPCYALGIHRIFHFFSRTVTWQDYLIAFTVFLIPDAIKCALAWIISKRLKKFVK
jgi:biotin transport system substrate-specific component